MFWIGLLFLLLLPRFANAAGPVDVYANGATPPTPAQYNWSVGQNSFDVRINTNGPQDVDTVSVAVQYDENCLTFVSEEDIGPFDTLWQAQASSGIVDVVRSKLGAPFPTGDQPVTRITFDVDPSCAGNNLTLTFYNDGVFHNSAAASAGVDVTRYATGATIYVAGSETPSATPAGTPVPTPEPGGSAVRLSKVNTTERTFSYIELPESASLLSSERWSISFWYKWDGLCYAPGSSDEWATLVENTRPDQVAFSALLKRSSLTPSDCLTQDTITSIAITINGTTYPDLGSITIRPNAWQNYIFSYIPSSINSWGNIALYIDGVSKFSQNIVPPTGFEIGNTTLLGDPNYGATGLFDSLGFYPISMDDATAATIYNNGQGTCLADIRTFVTELFQFDEGTGTATNGELGSLTGTLRGAGWEIGMSPCTPSPTPTPGIGVGAYGFSCYYGDGGSNREIRFASASVKPLTYIMIKHAGKYPMVFWNYKTPSYALSYDTKLTSTDGIKNVIASGNGSIGFTIGNNRYVNQKGEKYCYFAFSGTKSDSDIWGGIPFSQFTHSPGNITSPPAINISPVDTTNGGYSGNVTPEMALFMTNDVKMVAGVQVPQDGILGVMAMRRLGAEYVKREYACCGDLNGDFTLTKAEYAQCVENIDRPYDATFDAFFKCDCNLDGRITSLDKDTMTNMLKPAAYIENVLMNQYQCPRSSSPTTAEASRRYLSWYKAPETSLNPTPTPFLPSSGLDIFSGASRPNWFSGVGSNASANPDVYVSLPANSRASEYPNEYTGFSTFSVNSLDYSIRVGGWKGNGNSTNIHQIKCGGNGFIIVIGQDGKGLRIKDLRDVVHGTLYAGPYPIDNDSLVKVSMIHGSPVLFIGQESNKTSKNYYYNLFCTTSGYNIATSIAPTPVPARTLERPNTPTLVVPRTPPTPRATQTPTATAIPTATYGPSKVKAYFSGLRLGTIEFGDIVPIPFWED